MCPDWLLAHGMSTYTEPADPLGVNQSSTEAVL